MRCVYQSINRLDIISSLEFRVLDLLPREEFETVKILELIKIVQRVDSFKKIPPP